MKNRNSFIAQNNLGRINTVALIVISVVVTVVVIACFIWIFSIKNKNNEISNNVQTAQNDEDIANLEDADNTSDSDNNQNGDGAESQETQQGDENEEDPLASYEGPTLTYIGHASVKIVASTGEVIYIDPYYNDIPGAYDEPADIILVTHTHEDHNAVKLCTQKENCVVIKDKDALIDEEFQTFEIGNVKIQAVVSGGNGNHYWRNCVGYVVEVDGVRIYHAGDCSFSDKIKEENVGLNLDYAMYPIDGVYNMGPEEATEMANHIGAKVNIPIHGSIEKNCYQQTEAFTPDGKMLLFPGDTIPLK